MTHIDLVSSSKVDAGADQVEGPEHRGNPSESLAATGVTAFAPLLRETARPLAEAPVQSPCVWRLLAVLEEDQTALVAPVDSSGNVGTAVALRARTTVDLHGAHIGHDVLIVHEGGNPLLPIVTGVLRGRPGWPLAETPAQVQVDADGQRLVVTAQQQLVLRCGKASITLTQAGKVLIEGSYVLSRSTGVNRVKGGSVQLN